LIPNVEAKLKKQTRAPKLKLLYIPYYADKYGVIIALQMAANLKNEISQAYEKFKLFPENHLIVNV